MENDMTKAWELYEQGRSYNNRLAPNQGGQYRLVETNQAFFAGEQWLHLPDTPSMRGVLKPTFNILKRVASLFVASLTSSAVAVHCEPLASYGLPPGPGAAAGRLPQDPADFGGGGGFAFGGDTTAATGGGIRDFFPDSAPYAASGDPGTGGGEIAQDGEDVSVFANAEIGNLLEKFKFEYRVRDALFDGAQTGDYCAHFWFDPDAIPYRGLLGEERGEIRMELVDGINVIFGNPNDRAVENQPWILLVGRDTVEHLRDERRRYRMNRAISRGEGAARGEGTAAEDSAVQSDAETQDFPGVGGQTELEPDGQDGGKALYVLLYAREGETIRVTKATRTAVIYEDVDTGLSRYPIAWGNWEKQKHQYHGRALVTGLIPNQIFINTMFATAMRHLQISAFPKTIYNADLISAWSNEIGQAVAVRFGRNDPETARIPVSNIASTLPASDMSGQIFALIDKVMTYTRECLGATDAQMGNVRPDNTSALMVLQTNAEVPLENIRAGLHEWTEDIAHILLDMMGTYYGRRHVVVDQEMRDPVMDPATGLPALDPATGTLQTQTVSKRVVRLFDFSVFKRLWLHLRVDVGATTYFSEIAMTQTLDNLRRDGTLDVIQYLERVPEKLIPRKEELLQALKSGAAARGIQPEAAGAPGAPAVPSGAAPVQAGPLDEAAAVQGLPARFAQLYAAGRMAAPAKRAARQLGAQRLK